MGDMLKLIWWAVIGLFRSRASLEAEILTLRHQLNVLRRKSPKRLTFSNFDRLVFAILYGFAPRVLNALAIVEPETVNPTSLLPHQFASNGGKIKTQAASSQCGRRSLCAKTRRVVHKLPAFGRTAARSIACMMPNAMADRCDNRV
jgi:hypothetical protein